MGGKDALVEDTEAMTTDEKSEIEENFEKHDMVARAHTGDNTEEETEEEDEAMEGEPAGNEMETDAEKAEAEAGNLEQAWQMFDLAKVIYGKAGDVAKECESLTFLGEVSLENSNFKQAVEDLTLCLTKRIKALPADSRSMPRPTTSLAWRRLTVRSMPTLRRVWQLPWLCSTPGSPT